MAEVVSVGILVADAMGKPIDHFPDEDRLALFDRMELHIGGCAANTGIALKKLGAELPYTFCDNLHVLKFMEENG